MDFQYQPNDIAAGNINKNKSKETPNLFAEMDGAAQVTPSAPLDTSSKQRMAGPVGARALQLISDPEEARRTAVWLQKFAFSNQGMQFNQAKMMMMAPPQAPQGGPEQ